MAPGAATSAICSTCELDSLELAAAPVPFACSLVELKIDRAAICLLDEKGSTSHTTPTAIMASSDTSAAKPAEEPASPDRRVVARRGTPRLAYGRRAGIRWAQYMRQSTHFPQFIAPSEAAGPRFEPLPLTRSFLAV